MPPSRKPPRTRPPQGGRLSGPGGDLPDFGIELPPATLGLAAFAALDPDLPLALLPIRIETRYFLDHEPPELRVRLFPDDIHADGHVPGLTASEQDLGRAFWRRTWRAGRDPAAEDAAFAWLAAQLGPWRAAWVARRLTPTNVGKAPTEAVREGMPIKPGPRFPPVGAPPDGRLTWARLLPSRFAVVGYYDNEPVGTWWGAEIPSALAMAPGPIDVEQTIDAEAWLRAQGLAWTFDFEQAEVVGLGVRIDLSKIEKPIDPEGFDKLIVLGVRSGDHREALQALLDAHRYTHGLDFIPQGTPTNVTEAATPGPTLRSPDLAEVRAAELDAPSPASRPSIPEEGDLYRLSASDATSLALGLGAGNALDRAGNAGLGELARAEAMNRVLWPATLGHYLEALLQGALTSEGRAWLRGWSASFVRGAGPLPAIVIGRQPYGLLPTARVVATDFAAHSNVQHVEDALASWLAGYWRTSLAEVPHLDPDMSDVPPEGESQDSQAGIVSQVLGAVPHPTAFHLLQVDGMRATYNFQYAARMGILGLGCGSMPNPDAFPYESLDDNPAWQLFQTLESALQGTTSIELQLDLFKDFVADLARIGASPMQDEYLAGWVDYAQRALVDFVQAHSDRTDPTGWVSLFRPELTRMLSDEDDPSTFFAMHGELREWALPLVATGRTKDDVAGVRTWLSQLLDDIPDPRTGPVLDPSGGTSPTYDYTERLPLLQQLGRWAVQNATTPDDRSALRAGLADLVEIASSDADPIGELERLMRETLGACGYRLDAWYTAVAAWRLENKRRKTPRGIQVGAFGCLLNVKPRERKQPSQGYVLAPSLAHATTAAVLRAGWSAFGGSRETGGLAVDLSSHRIRRARWIVDGVRRGHDLGELLGGRLERRLLDAGIAHLIEDVRQAALDAIGSTAPPNAIVDGLLLARVHSNAADVTNREQRSYDKLLTAAGTDRAALEGVLDESVVDLDSTADAAVAQTVFSLTQGNIAEATATFTASATGEVAFPNLRFADTPPTAQAITHRLLALLDLDASSAWPAAASSGRSLAAPALEAWLSTLLGGPAAYGFSVRFADAGNALEGTLADVRLSALDLVLLAPAGEETGLGRLGALIASWAEGWRPAAAPAEFPPVIEATAGDPSLDEIMLVCRSLKQLVLGSRDLDARDLVAPGAADVPTGVDLADLDGRVSAVRTALDTGRTALVEALPAAAGEAARGDVRAAMLALAGFSLSGGIPRSTAPDGLVAEGTALVARIDARTTDLDARIAADEPGWAGRSEASRFDALRSRLHLLVGHELPVAPRIAPVNRDELAASAGRDRLGSPFAASGWLQSSGRVDPAARRLRLAIDMVEGARDDRLFEFSLVQLPDHETEGWAAVERPAHDERGRLCLLATGHAGLADDQLAGLVLGAWTESIPRGGRT
ncbi:MAG: hypothetical protein L0206_10925, partial [Actinobacteria bacterium]|nr:hypothetical protein [Actinomycetota bacterium]